MHRVREKEKYEKSKIGTNSNDNTSTTSQHQEGLEPFIPEIESTAAQEYIFSTEMSYL